MTKLFWRLSLMLMVAAVWGSVALAQSESLGDFARQQRAAKKTAPAKVINNEDLPTSAIISVTGSAEPEAAAGAGDKDKKEKSEAQGEDKDKKSEAKGEDKDKKATDAPGTKSDKAAGAEKSPEAAFRERYDEQKKQVSNLEREINLDQRETQLNNPAPWMGGDTTWQADSKRRKAAEDIAAKKEALEGAKQKLEEMQEEGRKSGVAPSPTE